MSRQEVSRLKGEGSAKRNDWLLKTFHVHISLDPKSKNKSIRKVIDELRSGKEDEKIVQD